MDYRLEVVVIPVSDVDRANEFYKALGWRVDADVVGDNDFRLVQVTPPASPCSIQFGTGLTTATPGSAFGSRRPGPAPEHATYASFASFADPDGNGWVLQEITTRLPGR